MSESDFPISKPYELGRLSQAGDDVEIAPSAEERLRLARWAGIEAIDAFVARIALRKLSATRFIVEARLAADIVQNCVVTLDPVRSHIERDFTRELLLTPGAQRVAQTIDIEPTPVDGDGLEEISSLRYDLAVPVLEELALAIDPYPRVPGVAFEPPAAEADSPEHPFAALKGLKRQN